jgi:hypothetical protein
MTLRQIDELTARLRGAIENLKDSASAEAMDSSDQLTARAEV